MKKNFWSELCVISVMLRFSFFLILFLSLQLQGFSQLVFNKTFHSFGLLTAKSERFIDFQVKNTSGKKVFLLRLDSEKDVTTLVSGQTLLPDSSITIRVQYNPKETGRFSREIDVYFSDRNEPITIMVSGEVREMPAYADLACPTFNKVPDVSRVPEFEAEIKVVDAHTGEPIVAGDVRIIYRGLPKYAWKTDKSGEIHRKMEIGYYYFVVTKPGYKPKEFDAYVNIRNNKLYVELIPEIDKGYDEPPVDSLFYAVSLPPIKDPGKPQEPEQVLVIDPGKIESKEPVLTEVEPGLSPVVEEPEVTVVPSHTPIEKTNNLVFLLDLSGSMAMDGKLDLLKASMIEVCKALKPEDRVSVLVYNDKARVVMEGVSGANKEEIIAKISGMEAEGYTAGFEGMKKAYEMAQKHFIPGGNNMVIMATDGAFNLYTNDVTPMVRRGLKKGIVTSVIGIKNTERDSKSMITVAEQGGGRYVPIQNLPDALTLLVSEIRTAASKP
jgi:Ca-activated chloride channel family protein